MRNFLKLAGVLMLLGLMGCGGTLTQERFHVNETYLDPTFGLEGVEIAFITSNAGNELEDHWALLDLLAQTLKEERKDIRVLLPAQSLSLINRAGMAKEYYEAIKEFQSSAILDKEILRKLKDVLGVQYVVHLSLNSFSQYPSTRLSLFGLRTIDSQTATLRLFVRILQTEQGSIVWEGSGEGIITREEFRARPITFDELAQLACQKLVEKMP